MKIEVLTKSQEARFPEFVEKWIKIGLCAEPADRPTAERGIELIYKEVGLKKPKIVWCSSPLANGLTRALVEDSVRDSVGASVEDLVRASVWASVEASVRASVGALVGDSVRDSVRALVGASVRASVEDSVRDSVGDSVRASVRALVGASVRALVWASVRDSVRASVRALVGDSVRALVGASVWASVGASVWASVGDSVWDSVGDSVRDSGYGQHDVDWLAFYDFFREVWGLEKETEKLKGHFLIAQSANWYLPHKNICWISERHNILNLNNRGQLHCENGLALAYPDGWGIYALNGIRTKPEYVLTPAGKITPEMILKEQNVDQRRELIRKVGVDKLTSQGKVVEENNGYKLIDMSPIFVGINYAPHLLMKNLSVPDTYHLEGVAPECKTIQQAINWRAGNIAIDWQPFMLS